MPRPLDTSTLGPVRIDPSRPSVLEAEITAVIAQGIADPRGDYFSHLARRILKIDRIAQALKLLDDVDSGAVELVCQGSSAR